MAIRTKADLKTDFETGDRPDGGSFEDLIDSFKHVNDSSGGASTGGQEEYLCLTSVGATTQVMFRGSATGVGDPKVTVATSSAGVIDVTVPEELTGKFDLGIPSEFTGVAGDGTVTVNITFLGARPFYQNEATMFPGTMDFYSRQTEGSGGFDVLLGGNNPQRRQLAFTSTGVVRAQIAAATSPYMIRVEI